MKKFASAATIALIAILLLSLGGMAQAQEYQDFVGTWNINIESCRPCVMTITAVDSRGNVIGTHTSLQGEVTPLVGKIVKKKGDLWLVAKTAYGTAEVEVALCEGEMDGHYTVVESGRPFHHKAVYAQTASLP